jgi:hypothetical protein
MSASPLDAAAVAAIVAHLNDDHGEDMLTICRTLGGRPDAVAAIVTSVDVDGLTLRAIAPGSSGCKAAPEEGGAPDRCRGDVVRLGWHAPIRMRSDVRIQVVRLCDEAVALGS